MPDNSLLYIAVSLLIIGAITTYFKVIAISKTIRFTLAEGQVKDKAYLDYLLTVKSFPFKLPTIEVVS